MNCYDLTARLIDAVRPIARRYLQPNAPLHRVRISVGDLGFEGDDARSIPWLLSARRPMILFDMGGGDRKRTYRIRYVRPHLYVETHHLPERLTMAGE